MEDIKILNEKELIELIRSHRSKREEILRNKRYYRNENDIVKTGVLPADGQDSLRSADNRISHNFHQLMVDEKAAYMFTYAVQFDLDNKEELNKDVAETLGDELESISQELCVEASNCGTSFLHYWIDEENEKEFEYALVPTEEIIVIYNRSLKKNIIEVFRYYSYKENDKSYTVVEQWDKENFITYTLQGSSEIEGLKLLNIEEVKHNLEAVPFIEFKNNKDKIPDLNKYKDLIDLADKVMSGYANDIEDIQQLIYVLEGYGGQDLQEFKSDLKRYKAIKVDGGTDGGAVKTLQIEIPVEARVKLIEILEKRIYESGQALQQNIESVGQASGVALKFFYRKLELKCGLTETQFKKGFDELIRAILKFLKKDAKKITQVYSRNMISNDMETAQMASISAGIISEKSVLKNHAWVEDAEQEIEELKKERVESIPDLNQDGNLNE